MTDTTATCATCNKKFLIIEQELEFLKKKNLALPSLCPTDRQLRRMKDRGERTLYKTTCRKCDAGMITTFNPNTFTAETKIFCQQCYREYFDKTDVLQK